MSNERIIGFNYKETQIIKHALAYYLQRDQEKFLGDKKTETKLLEKISERVIEIKSKYRIREG